MKTILEGIFATSLFVLLSVTVISLMFAVDKKWDSNIVLTVIISCFIVSGGLSRGLFKFLNEAKSRSDSEGK